jgi:hypothetical protein
MRERPYHQIARGVRLRLRGTDLPRQTRQYLASVAAEHDYAGMFVRTSRPLPAGSVVSFDVEGPAETLRGHAVVRWRRRWLGVRGMALDFIDFEGLGTEDVHSRCARLLRAHLTTSPVASAQLSCCGPRARQNRPRRAYGHACGDFVCARGPRDGHLNAGSVRGYEMCSSTT